MKSPRHCYEFGPFRLDPSERQLLRAGQVMPLTPKVFDTLLLFVENSNLLLTKDEMLGRLWPDSFVEESNLAQNVSMLRRELGDQPDGKLYIETVPKRGYRFIAEVRLCAEERRGELAFSPSGGEDDACFFHFFSTAFCFEIVFAAEDSETAMNSRKRKVQFRFNFRGKLGMFTGRRTGLPPRHRMNGLESVLIFEVFEFFDFG